VSQPRHGTYRPTDLTIDLKPSIFEFQGRSVIDFCVNRKGLWDFLLVTNSKLGHLAPFMKYGDFWLEIANVSHPT